jgi:biopolymer transport protein ExbD
MVSFKHLAILAVILVGLTVSGCVDKLPEESVQEELPQQEETPAVVDVLGNEGVGLTDTEITDLEDEIAELEAMLEDLDLDENLSLEEI